VNGSFPAAWFAGLQPPPEMVNEVRISVLLPTRGRPEALARTIDSLLKSALRPESIEILLAVDRDDAATLAMLPELPPCVHSIVMPRRGYGRFNEYLNLLARLASGYWTILWNDDSLMQTPGWDEIICRQPDCIGAMVSNHGYENVMPVVPRHWVALVGHYSLQTHSDSWWEKISELTGTARVIPVEFLHDRADLTGNNLDTTYQERDYKSEDFYSEAIQSLIREDAGSLMAWRRFEASLAESAQMEAANES
ncbi:MAG: glycosyltransferase family 2 protein, partial [Thermomicrobiales bacterium]